MKLTEEQKKAALAGIEAGKKVIEEGIAKKRPWWAIALSALLAAALTAAYLLLSPGCAGMPDMTLTRPDGGSISIQGPRPIEVQKVK